MSRLRFSVRTLLIGVFAISLLLAGAAPFVRRGRAVTSTEREIVRQINEIEWGYVDAHQYGFPEGTAFVVSVDVGCPDPDALMRELAPMLAELRRVDLYAAGTDMTDAGLSALHSVSTLREVLVDDTQVSESGIVTLQRKVQNCKIVHATRAWYLSV